MNNFQDRQAARVGRYRIKRWRRSRNLHQKGGTDGHGAVVKSAQSRGATGVNGGILAFTAPMEHIQSLKRKELEKRYQWDSKLRITVRRD